MKLVSTFIPTMQGMHYCSSYETPDGSKIPSYMTYIVIITTEIANLMVMLTKTIDTSTFPHTYSSKY